MTRKEQGAFDREQKSRIASDRELRYRIVEADFGRALPWEVIWEGVTVAMLSKPRRKSDGWVSYEIEQLISESDKLLAHKSSGFFWLHADVEYRNSELNLIAIHALPVAEGPVKGRLMMRGLHFDVELSFLDRLRMLFRKTRPTANRQ